MAITAQEDPDAPVAVARILRSQHGHPLQDRSVTALVERYPSAEAGHLQQRAGSSLGQASALRIRHLLATGRHAYHFFAAISFITSISRSRSATSFFSRAFS